MSALATGPRTVEGKEHSSRNATKHGLRSESPVVPGEDAGEWDAFRASTVADLDPGSFLERELAERVALQLWRLRRAGRYEAEVAEDEFDKVRTETLLRFGYLEPQDPVSQALVEQTRLILEEEKAQAPFEAGRKLLRHLPNLVNSAPLETVEVLALMALLGIEDTNELPAPLTARTLRRALADWSGLSMVEALPWASRIVEEKYLKMAERLAVMKKRQAGLDEQFQEQIARQQRDQRLLPKGALDRVIRYEAHVSRQLYQALQLLRQFKEERLAKAAVGGDTQTTPPVVAPEPAVSEAVVREQVVRETPAEPCVESRETQAVQGVDEREFVRYFGVECATTSPERQRPVAHVAGAPGSSSS